MPAIRSWRSSAPSPLLLPALPADTQLLLHLTQQQTRLQALRPGQRPGLFVAAPEVNGEDLPVLALITNIHPVLGYLMSLAIFGMIFARPLSWLISRVW